jgi:hypothetical protein
MGARIAVIILAAATVAAQPAFAESGLTAARTLYDDAQYGQALVMLDELVAADAAGGATAEVHQFRALCLIALGRHDEADRAMAATVAADPHFRPDPGTVSPRVVSMFAAARRRLLPSAIRQAFAAATALHREGARALAVEQFGDLLRLLDDPALRDDQSLADLAVVASAFVDLYRAQAQEAVAPQSAPAKAGPGSSVPVTPGQAEAVPTEVATAPPTTPPTASPTTSASTHVAAPADSPPPTLETPAFTAPVALAQELPKWMPPDTLSARRTFFGAITVLVDEQGRVIAARKKRGIHPAYDPVVLEAARRWSYMPAFRNGLAVRSELTVEVQLNPPVE